MQFFSFFSPSCASLKAPSNTVPAPLQLLTPERSTKGEEDASASRRPPFAFPNKKKKCLGTESILMFVFPYSVAHSNRGKGGVQEGRRRERGNSWGATSNEKRTGRGLFCLCATRWAGGAAWRVHQIFIRASVHSLEAHYGTKAAENILEEQLNKKKWFIYRP